MNRKKALFTRTEMVGYVTFLVVVAVLTHVGFFHFKGRQATAAVDAELSTTLAPQLRKHGVTSFKVTSAGLQFVANGRTMCLLKGGTDALERYRIVAIAERAGCGEESKVMLLDSVQTTMVSGHGLSFFNLRDDEEVVAERSKDGSWLSTVELNWPTAEVGRRISVRVAEDIEGLFSVLNIAPSEARTPAALQAYLSR